MTWAVGVVIPARNEAASIARCITSVLASCDACNRCDTVWIAVVADRCTDGTQELARRCLGVRGEVLECAAGSPGTARRLGVAAVLRRLEGHNPQRLWLANTDADTYVPLDWIGTHLHYADANAEGVAGIVQLDEAGLREDVKALYGSIYTVAADGTHTHVHGANFGVRAHAYMAAGGWSDLTVSEDHCLWKRLMRRGSRLRSPAASVVHTSGRLRGRAIGGFADSLRRGLTVGE